MPPLPAAPFPGAGYAVTIADLGEFDAETYTARLEDWGRATLAAWTAAP